MPDKTESEKSLNKHFYASDQSISLRLSYELYKLYNTDRQATIVRLGNYEVPAVGVRRTKNTSLSWLGSFLSSFGFHDF